MSRSELNVSRWLEAHSDRSANLKTLPRNAILANVTGDGDYRLVITDLKLEKDTRCRLKVYKGPVLTSDQALQDVPSAIISFFMDQFEPRIPVVAISCGSDMLIYKNNKPFFKFTVPSVPLLPAETEAWTRIFEYGNEALDVVDELKKLPFSSLSPRSQQLVNLPVSKIDEFIKTYSGSQPVKTPPITCMTTLNRSSPDKLAIACPVIGTETGDIYFLDSQTFTIIHQANSCSSKSSPCIMHSTGIFDVEFRLFIATREKSVCLIRRGWLEGKMIIQLTEDIVDMLIIPGDHFITLATTDKNLHCYTKRGQRLWTTKMVNTVTCLCLVPLQHLTTHLVAVGMKGGLIHLYQGRHPVDYTSVFDTPSVITFGQLGQEEHVMVIITLGGTINFKILKRTADFNLANTDNHNAAPTLQSRPLPLPKRSKLFLEQSLREKQNAIDIHQNFQQDLVRLRLTTARALVNNRSDNTGIGNEKEQIKLSAQVLGLGPKFTLILTLENMNASKPIFDYVVIFHTKPTLYHLSAYIKQVPLIPPSLSYKMEINIEEILPSNEVQSQLQSGGMIRVFVSRQEQIQPILAATINMPLTEFPL